MIVRTIRSIPISSSSSSHGHSKVSIVSRKKDELSLPKKTRRRRSLVTVSTGDAKWQGNWTCQYLISLQDLQLQDLIDDLTHDEDHQQQHKDAQVSVTLTVQKHASFGLSVDGRILTSFTRNCTNCFSPYCRQIDSKFNVWVLLSNQDDNHEHQLPEIGGDDPSVIYVKPGCEADLDSLIQDTLRLTVSVQDFCSESCEKSEPTFQVIGRQSSDSIDKRWSRLLELKKTNSNS